VERPKPGRLHAPLAWRLPKLMAFDQGAVTASIVAAYLHVCRYRQHRQTWRSTATTVAADIIDLQKYEFNPLASFAFHAQTPHRT
ncbi:MAG: hypothetical protein K2R98_09410, partial [Gemmataceae bacterium]|nr:hypothetical protein [Gemmataceae bacterium]